jgi:hypothetical protein
MAMNNNTLNPLGNSDNMAMNNNTHNPLGNSGNMAMNNNTHNPLGNSGNMEDPIQIWSAFEYAEINAGNVFLDIFVRNPHLLNLLFEMLCFSNPVKTEGMVHFGPDPAAALALARASRGLWMHSKKHTPYIYFSRRIKSYYSQMVAIAWQVLVAIAWQVLERGKVTPLFLTNALCALDHWQAQDKLGEKLNDTRAAQCLFSGAYVDYKAAVLIFKHMTEEAVLKCIMIAKKDEHMRAGLCKGNTELAHLAGKSHYILRGLLDISGPADFENFHMQEIFLHMPATDLEYYTQKYTRFLSPNLLSCRWYNVSKDTGTLLVKTFPQLEAVSLGRELTDLVEDADLEKRREIKKRLADLL